MSRAAPGLVHWGVGRGRAASHARTTMATVDPAPSTDAPAGDVGVRRWRGLLLGLAIARYVIPIGALALIPVLFPDRLELLTLLRPGKESLLAVGGIYRTSGGEQPDLLLAFLAFLPLMLFAVWVFVLNHKIQHGPDEGASKPAKSGGFFGSAAALAGENRSLLDAGQHEDAGGKEASDV